jgi:hypothetical protein
VRGAYEKEGAKGMASLEVMGLILKRIYETDACYSSNGKCA